MSICLHVSGNLRGSNRIIFHESVYTGKSGQLKNTKFAILSLDGNRRLTAAGRGLVPVFHRAVNMVAIMNRVTSQNTRERNPLLMDTRLPLMKNVDLDLNVAAADGLSLIVTITDNNKQLERINESLVYLAWKDSFLGPFISASILDNRELQPITGIDVDEGILVIDLGQFGLSGKVSVQFGSEVNLNDLEASLRHVISGFRRKYQDHTVHVALGIQLGIDL